MLQPGRPNGVVAGVRTLSIVLIVVLAACAPSRAAPVPPTPAPEPWLAEGLCLQAYGGGGACVMVMPADAEAIRQAVLDGIDALHADWHVARKLASRPVRRSVIGGYQIEAYVFHGFEGDVVRLVGIDRSAHPAEGGYQVVVGREPDGSWRVLQLERYRERKMKVWR
jgi:hypothetical protein